MGDSPGSLAGGAAVSGRAESRHARAQEGHRVGRYMASRQMPRSANSLLRMHSSGDVYELLWVCLNRPPLRGGKQHQFGGVVELAG